ncbi:MAG: tRNA pseudouridine(55) synthase TruB [Gammaproteobacteria bacterium]|nr:tRNA pseudouridine(55) synthase TruB [Gammaproteobacteria bacterium]
MKESGTSDSARPAWRAIDGILLLDKPLGWSSNQALQRVRRLLGAARGGHTGSLDPLATGMLPLCLGQATKFSSFHLAADKRYLVRLVLGVRTSSGDREGDPMERGPDILPPGRLEGVLAGFLGPQMQIPPMYSALKRDGQPLYRLARRGIDVEREARPIVIGSLRLMSVGPAGAVLEVGCSKGTYIRTLVEDIASAAGTVGHVAELRRLVVEPFDPAGMVTLEALEADCIEGRLARVLPVDAGLDRLPSLVLLADEVLRLRQGLPLMRAGLAAGPTTLRAYGPNGEFQGVVEADAGGVIRVRRLMSG